jgi:hypothetical protein
MGLHGGRKTCQTTSRGREAPSNQFLKFEEFLKFPCFKKSNNFFFGLVQLLTFIQQAACTSERVASTSNERVASAQKRGSARHLSSGEKGHFSTAGIRLSWILGYFGLDFLGIFGLHFEHNLAWTCLSFKVCATWIEAVLSKGAKSTIFKSV